MESAEEVIDPINDIIDYLVRVANISFKNAHVNENEIKTNEKICLANDLYNKSPTNFLLQFGKHLAPQHMIYFEKLNIPNTSEGKSLEQCITNLKLYHSDKVRRKRIRNRRFGAMQKLKNDTDYFSEKEMMYRNPLLYEQLVGQYLTDAEIQQRDGADPENLTLLSMILDTVDRNEMREKRNEQIYNEDEAINNLNKLNSSSGRESSNCDEDEESQDAEESQICREKWGEFETDHDNKPQQHRWGDFKKRDTLPSFKPEVRKQAYINAQERRLLRQEFEQEMISSFIEGRDVDVDYNSIDKDEQYDDLEQVTQDAEDKYFDSEQNDVDNLEEHMNLVNAYGKKNSNDSNTDDTLDEFMEHLNKRLVT